MKVLKPLVVIALGGNAMIRGNQKGTMEEQVVNITATAKQIMKVIDKYRVVITHGNGPQAGNLSVQQQAAKHLVPAHPLDVVGAMTQGQIGYMLQRSLNNALIDRKVDIPAIAVVNFVLVDKEDSEFFGENASKPVGEFMKEEEAVEQKKLHPLDFRCNFY